MRNIYRDVFKYSIIGDFFRYIRLKNLQIKWIVKNRNNQTIPNCYFDPFLVNVDDYSYGLLNVISYGKETTLTVGKYVSIAENVVFMLDVEHWTNHLSTYPFLVKVLKNCKYESFSKGNIIVEDDVWIGYGSVILSGVKIGKGAVIAANSLVVKDIPPYSIVGGCPAKVIKYRFEDDIIDELMKFDYSKLSYEKIQNNIQLLYSVINRDNLKDINSFLE